MCFIFFSESNEVFGLLRKLEAAIRENHQAIIRVEGKIDGALAVSGPDEMLNGTELGEKYHIEMPLRTMGQFEDFEKRLARDGDLAFRKDVVSIGFIFIFCFFFLNPHSPSCMLFFFVNFFIFFKTLFLILIFLFFQKLALTGALDARRSYSRSTVTMLKQILAPELAVQFTAVKIVPGKVIILGTRTHNMMAG